MMIAQIQEHMSAFGADRTWPATLRFGQSLQEDTASRSTAAGMRCAHFEVKGFAGYPDEDQAAATILSDLATARQWGCRCWLHWLMDFLPTARRDSNALCPFLLGVLTGWTVRRIPAVSDPDRGTAAYRPRGKWDRLGRRGPDTHDLARSLPIFMQSGFDSAHYAASAPKRWPVSEPKARISRQLR